MKQTFVDQALTRSGERGGSRLKFLIVASVIALVAYGSYLYIPVRYDAYLYQDLMQHYVDVASATGKPTTWVVEQLTKSAKEYNVPPEATVTSSQEENRVIATVRFTRPIQLFSYTYNYEFDHTAKSTAFLSVK
jgi:hypothetical protein